MEIQDKRIVEEEEELKTVMQEEINGTIVEQDNKLVFIEEGNVED